MSEARRRQLDAREAALVARQAQLRARLAADVAPLQPVFGTADRVRDALRWLRANPLVVGGGVAVLVALRPRRAWRLALRAWTAWRVARPVLREAQRWHALFSRLGPIAVRRPGRPPPAVRPARPGP